MENEYQKIDANTLSVTKTKPSEVLPPVQYDYSFLKKQLVDIQAQKDRDNTLRDAEIAEVELLISEAGKLGIVEKVVDPKLPETPIEKVIA